MKVFVCGAQPEPYCMHGFGLTNAPGCIYLSFYPMQMVFAVLAQWRPSMTPLFIALASAQSHTLTLFSLKFYSLIVKPVSDLVNILLVMKVFQFQHIVAGLIVLGLYLYILYIIAFWINKKPNLQTNVEVSLCSMPYWN